MVRLNFSDKLLYPKSIIILLVISNPSIVMEWRDELGIDSNIKLFLMIVCICDNLLIYEQSSITREIGSFFNITCKLPIELQMLICNYKYDIALPSNPLMEELNVRAGCL